jgi:hypothetical protein
MSAIGYQGEGLVNTYMCRRMCISGQLSFVNVEGFGESYELPRPGHYALLSVTYLPATPAAECPETSNVVVMYTPLRR